ncbi:MAG: DNA-binding beta-propeller fold protein YncE [Saprospiraceae bacterium]
MRFTLLLSFLCFFSGGIFSQEITKYLVLSDADTALAIGLKSKQSQYRTQRDSLTIIQIDTSGIVTQNSIFLSNSIINKAKAVAISSDKTTAYILQSRGEFPDSMRYSTELDWKLPIEKTLLAVDISNVDDLKIIDTINVGKSPFAVVLSPDGKSLALTVDEKHSEIIRINLENNRFKYVFRHPHAVYSKKGNIRATDISWHPSGKYFAVTLEEDRTVAFYKFIETPYGTKLALFGAPVEVGKLPTKTEFTPDGNYCIVINQDSTEMKSELTSIEFDESSNHNIADRHLMALHPKCFDISPNGKQIIVLNKEGSEYPPTFQNNYNSYFSISLFDLTENGSLIQVNESRITGSKAESIKFDKSGNQILLSYSQFPESKRGGIVIYEISDDNKLHKMEVKLETPQGTHLIKEL